MADQADPLGIDLFPLGEERQCVLGVRHLVEAAHLRSLALALTAGAEIETKCHVAHLFKYPGLNFSVGFVLRPDEAVQDNEGRQKLARFPRIRHMENGRKFEPVRAESELFLHWNILVLLCPAARSSGARARAGPAVS